MTNFDFCDFSLCNSVVLNALCAEKINLKS